MYHKLMKWSAIIALPLMTLAIAAMLVYSWKKPLVYVHAQDGGGTQYMELDGTDQEEFVKLSPVLKPSAETLCIPVKDPVTQDSVRIESDYVNHIFTITLEGMRAKDIMPDKVYGNLKGVVSVQAADLEGKLTVAVITDGVYEYGAIMENQKLILSLKDPAQMYDRIVVLDAGHGGSDTGIMENGVSENEFTADIAQRVCDLLAGKNIRVYLTGTEKDNPDIARRTALAKDAGADMFVSLHLAKGTTYGIRAVYNSAYFTPELTNAQLADLLVRASASAVNNRGIGVDALIKRQTQAWRDEDILLEMKIPSAYLELGAPQNEQEAALLLRDDYRQDLAEGICDAILKAYEIKTQ